MPGRRCRLLSLWEMVGDISETTQSPVYGGLEFWINLVPGPRQPLWTRVSGAHRQEGGRGETARRSAARIQIPPAGGPGKAWVAAPRSRFREFAGAPAAAAPGSRLAERAVALRWWRARNCGGTRTPACPPAARRSPLLQQPAPCLADTGGTG